MKKNTRPMTKRERTAYASYNKSNKKSLIEAYPGGCSYMKLEAWEHCESLMKEKGGRDLKVIGANTAHFSAGFVYDDHEGAHFVYITHGGDEDRLIV